MKIRKQHQAGRLYGQIRNRFKHCLCNKGQSSFGANQPKPKGKVFVNPGMGMLLIASNLPQAPAGKLYELWLIPKGRDAKPMRSGMFQSEANGTVMHVERGAVDVNTTAAVAVTLEVETGVDAPTNTPIIVAVVAPGLQ